VRVAKTIQITNRLNQLLLNFTADKNINQREFFEIAVIEMMKKYGYEAEIKGLLGWRDKWSQSLHPILGLFE